MIRNVLLAMTGAAVCAAYMGTATPVSGDDTPLTKSDQAVGAFPPGVRVYSQAEMLGVPAAAAGTDMFAALEAAPINDHRAWQHGVSLVRVGDAYLVAWSSWGLWPHPRMNSGEHWQHDVYYSWLDPYDLALDARTLVAGPEAQEPASTAVNSQGRILMTCEDGNPDINQHAALWDAGLNPIRSYPMNIRTGGHSGHVAAMGDRFLVTYSEGWIEGGGVDNLGTGDDVWARVVDNDGNMGPEIPVSVDPSADKRDWWPVVAASSTEGLVVWQRYPSDTLWGAIVRPDGSRGDEFPITDAVKYYYYNATYLPSLGLFAVFGSRLDGGYVALIDRTGRIVATQAGLPDTVRESTLVSRADGNGVVAVYPTLPAGFAELRLSRNSIALTGTVAAPFEWDYTGTDGAFIDRNDLLFVTLSKHGLQVVTVGL